MTNAPTRVGRVVNKAIAACLIAAIAGACAAARGPAQLGSPLAGASSETDWARVGQLAPAAEVFVTVPGSQPRTRHRFASDESSLIALNLGSASLPPEAVRTLRDMAAHYPERLVSLQKGGAIDEILEITARGSISRIDGPVVERGSVGGSLLGAFLGFSVGVVPALGGASEGVAWLLLAGSVAVGAYLGDYWSRHTTDGLVYQAIQ